MRRALAPMMTMAAVLAGCGQPGPTGPLPTESASPALVTAPAGSPEIPRASDPSPIAAAPTGRIAFIRPETPIEGSQVDIYLVDAGGGEPARLTNDPRDERDLYWTVDGSRLLYTWQEPGPEGGWGTYHQVLGSVRPDGTDRRDLGPVQTLYAPPAYSPDRRSIVFSGDGSEDGSSGLVLLSLVDGTRRQLTTSGETEAIWSPDGSRILAFLPSRRLVVIDAATGDELARISDIGVDAVHGWTADGLSVVYHRCGPDLNKDQCMAAAPLAADADGTNVRPYTGVVPRPASEAAAVSPDGRWLAGWASGALEVTPVAGGPAVQNVPLGGHASWSADSAWLVFSGQAAEPVASGQGPRSWLYLVPVTGGNPIPLTRGNDSSPAWQPS